jgi:hypothetical protein
MSLRGVYGAKNPVVDFQIETFFAVFIVGYPPLAPLYN